MKYTGNPVMDQHVFLEDIVIIFNQRVLMFVINFVQQTCVPIFIPYIT